MDTKPLRSSRPYLVRALYQWIVDNQCTPHLLVDATRDGVTVPRQFVKDGQIVLNVSPTAVVGLQMQNDCVFFDARFAGVPMQVVVPMQAVLGVYARENGQGMMFDPNEEGFDPEPPQGPETNPDSTEKKSSRPSLKVVK
jgi:stringent starvation protein B